jgi:two-component system phosphate regulon sensor histidine kinase PhoR
MLKIISTIGFLVTLILFLNSNITAEILFIINIFFIIIFFYKPNYITENFYQDTTEVLDEKMSKNNLQEIFINQLEDIIIILNKFNVIIFANISALNFFGNKLLSQNIGSQIRIPDLLDAIDQNRQDKLLKKIDLEIKFPTYKYLKADIISTELENVIIIMRDYTEVKKSQDLRSDFVANVSHELKTPLTSIKGFLEVIETSAKDDPQMQKKSIKIMLAQANKMQILIDDLLLLNRIEQQEHIKLRDRVNIIEVLKEVISNYINKIFFQSLLFKIIQLC